MNTCMGTTPQHESMHLAVERDDWDTTEITGQRNYATEKVMLCQARINISEVAEKLQNHELDMCAKHKGPSPISWVGPVGCRQQTHKV